MSSTIPAELGKVSLLMNDIYTWASAYCMKFVPLGIKPYFHLCNLHILCISALSVNAKSFYSSCPRFTDQGKSKDTSIPIIAITTNN